MRSVAQSTSYSMGIMSLSPRVKYPEHEAEQSPPSDTEIKNDRSYTSNPLILLWLT